MTPLFYHFHRRSASLDAGRSIHPLPPKKDWPKEWRTIYYKSYPGTAVVPLPTPASPPADFFDLVEHRKSVRGSHAKGITASELSAILKYSCGLQKTVREAEGARLRAEPSSDAHFPIEAYILSLKKENGIAPGIYHYNVKSHALETLRLREFSDENITHLFTSPWAKDCSMALVLTAVFERGYGKYGEQAYRFALLEAGHIGQGVYLSGGASGVGVIGMGETRDTALDALLDLDGTHESLVYALMLSK